MIFISYSSKDELIAQEIKSVLEEAKYEYWMAPESIPAGEDYAESIPAAIESCDAFLLVISENAMASKYVKKELKLAFEHSKPVIPAKIDESKLTPDFKFLLIDTQIIEVASPYSELADAIEKYIK